MSPPVAAYRCPTCDLAYPAAQDQGRCRVCDASLVYNTGLDPTPDIDERVAHLLDSDEGKVTRWRLEQFLTLGFPVEEAETLAARRDVDLHQAARLVAAGCDLATVLRIVG